MADPGRVRLGLSAWNYPAWKESFSAGVERNDWLSHAATRFETIEVNATFCRERKPATLERWRYAFRPRLPACGQPKGRILRPSSSRAQRPFS